MPRHGWLVALLCLIALGCRQAPPEYVPVTGRITYKGLTLRSGMIVFTPDNSRGHSGPIAVGAIRSDGSYELRTADNAGAVAGWYRVTVAALSDSGGKLGDRHFAIPRSAVPEKYRDPELSKLGCEVIAGQTNIVNFDLE